jgi:hypothetical protein
MFKALFGNNIVENILLFLYTRGEGYPRGISSAYKGQLTSYILQLKKLEKGGVLASKLKGRTRIYVFNPRYPFLKELKALLEKALLFIPKAEKDKYYMPRLRPRRSGKPL